MELIWIDALDDRAYTEECRKKGVDREEEDFNIVDPARFHRKCTGPFCQDSSSDWFGDMLPEGWVSADVYNWCTSILLRDNSGRLIQIATDWDNEHFEDCDDYPTIFTAGDPADVNSMSVCARYIEKYSKEIDDWYQAHSKQN